MSTATETAASMPEHNRKREDQVVVCAWCVPQQILYMDVRAGDAFIFYVADDGSLLVHRRRGEPGYRQLAISHGICEECKRKTVQ